MINQILEEIRNALANGNCILALMGALSLPDACGKAEYPNLKPSERYKKWYQEWIGQYEKSLEPDDDMPYEDADTIYDLRCRLLHEGNPSVNKRQRKLTSFVLMKTKGYVYGGSASCDDSGANRTLEIAIGNLVFKLCACAESYYKKNKEKFSFDYTLVDDPF